MTTLISDTKKKSAQKHINTLVEQLKQVNPDKIILFGSHASGSALADSDLDILVVTADDGIPASFAEKSKIYLRVSKTISNIKKEQAVDLVVHTRAMHQQFIETNSAFAREVLLNGKVLYEKEH